MKMEPSQLAPLVEALLFAARQPLTAQSLAKAVKDSSVSPSDIKTVLDGLGEGYDRDRRGFKLVRLGSGYQVVTRARYEPWVKNMLAGRMKTRLSLASLETVAVIAYKQPITRLEIERVRGVDVGGVLSTLLERNLIMIKGRDPGPGRPLLYGTTAGFLDYFGIARLGDLPKMEEIAALARERTPDAWDESERARFERYGVDPDIPPEEEEEADLEAGPDPEAPGEDRADSRAEEREMFQEVATDFVSSAAGEEEGADRADTEPPAPSTTGP